MPVSPTGSNHKDRLLQWDTIANSEGPNGRQSQIQVATMAGDHKSHVPHAGQPQIPAAPMRGSHKLESPQMGGNHQSLSPQWDTMTN